MAKDAVIRARTDIKLKEQVDEILSTLGMTHSQVINMFYSQIVLHQGLPFVVKIPNQTTVDAMEKSNRGEGEKFNSVDDLFADLDD